MSVADVEKGNTALPKKLIAIGIIATIMGLLLTTKPLRDFFRSMRMYILATHLYYTGTRIGTIIGIVGVGILSAGVIQLWYFKRESS